MKSLLLRMAVITVAALVVGIVVNEHHARGIRWQVLKLSLPWTGDAGWTSISADSAFSLFLDGEATFVDVRTLDDYRIDHIAGAVSIPFYEAFSAPGALGTLNPDDTVILYDLERDAPAPRLVARYLVRRNFAHVFVMRGGFIEWLDKTYPVETGYE